MWLSHSIGLCVWLSKMKARNWPKAGACPTFSENVYSHSVLLSGASSGAQAAICSVSCFQLAQSLSLSWPRLFCACLFDTLLSHLFHTLVCVFTLLLVISLAFPLPSLLFRHLHFCLSSSFFASSINFPLYFFFSYFLSIPLFAHFLIPLPFCVFPLLFFY